MPNKTTTQILKEFTHRFAIRVGELRNVDEFTVEGIVKKEVGDFLAEALSQQQQEDYQEVLDLELMKDEEEPPMNISYDLLREIQAKNDLRKELRAAIAEKRGKV